MHPGQFFAGGEQVAIPQQISLAQFHWIETQMFGDLIHLAFIRPHGLRHAEESIRTWGILYGPDMAEPPLRATTGPMSLYAPVLKFAVTCRATSVPSFITPVLMRMVAGCLHTVTNSSSLLSTIFTGRFDFNAKNAVIGSSRSEPFEPKPPPKVSTITRTAAD